MGESYGCNHDTNKCVDEKMKMHSTGPCVLTAITDIALEGTKSLKSLQHNYYYMTCLKFVADITHALTG